MPSTRLEILYFEGCPSWRLAHQRLQEAAELEGLPGAEILLRHVEDDRQARQLSFRGSPTVLINGIDPFAEPEAPIGFSCRVYRSGTGAEQAPTVEQLRRALQQA